MKTVPVQAGGRVFRIGDIAEVRRGYEDPPSFTMRYNGRPAVGVGVVMSRGENMLRVGEALEAERKRIEAELPAGAEMHTVAFQPRVVEESVGEFERSFAEALVIVLGVGFLSLGVRSGVVVALCVPLVLAIVLVAMKALGMNLDRISLGALIIALGLLVDDAIITVEMMLVKIEQGWDRARAASHAWTTTAFPMLVGTLITVAGFIPIGFANSIGGRVRGRHLLGGGARPDRILVRGRRVRPVPRARLLPKPVEQPHPPRPVPAVVLQTVPLPVGILRPAPVARGGRDVRLVRGRSVRARQGGEELLSAVEPARTAGRTAAPGRVVVRGHGGRSPETRAGADRRPRHRELHRLHRRRVAAVLAPREPRSAEPQFRQVRDRDEGAPEGARAASRSRLLPLFGGDDTFALPRGRVLRLDLGPPVGFPVQFRVVGPDRTKVREIAERVRDVVRQEPGAVDAQLEWHEPSKVVRLQLDQDRARALGLTPTDIADTLQTMLSGTRLSQYREGTELIDVVARAVPEERLNLDGLPDLNLITPAGHTVALSQVATVTYQLEEPILWRRNRETVLTVRADVADGAQPPDVTARILPKLEPSGPASRPATASTQAGPWRRATRRTAPCSASSR